MCYLDSMLKARESQRMRQRFDATHCSIVRICVSQYLQIVYELLWKCERVREKFNHRLVIDFDFAISMSFPFYMYYLVARILRLKCFKWNTHSLSQSGFLSLSLYMYISVFPFVLVLCLLHSSNSIVRIMTSRTKRIVTWNPKHSENKDNTRKGNNCTVVCCEHGSLWVVPIRMYLFSLWFYSPFYPMEAFHFLLLICLSFASVHCI